MSARPILRALSLVLLAALAAACGASQPADPPVATPSVALSRDRAPAGSPIDITYRFVVADDAEFDSDYRVMLHVVDSDEERMWDDDHDPPVPTSRWKPGETIEYTRTVFVPIFPYIGDASLHIGLYSAAEQRRLPLGGEHVGQLAYRVARLELLPQTENLFTVFRDGWHPVEAAADNAMIEWQWTKKEATLTFRNPKRDATLYLEVDNPASSYVGAQEIQVSVGGRPAERFTLAPGGRVLRRVSLPSELLGSSEVAEIQIEVDKTFVPARTPAADSKDPRELGVRVFHASVVPW